MRIFTFCLLGLLFLSGCRGENGKSRVYKNDGNISDVMGNPADSSVSYFPQKLLVKSPFFRERLSTWSDSMDFRIKNMDFEYIREHFLILKEPLLYNYYLNKDVIRLLWLRSFHRPVMIKMEKEGDVVTLTTKILNTHPDFSTPKSTIKFIPHLKRSMHRGKVIRTATSS